jgi:SAM-dependent methyltransferase
MDSSSYKDLTTDANKLHNRIKLNSLSQKFDFNSWLFGLMPKIQNDHKILDIGCGNGTQTNWFLTRIEPKGKVLAIDASAESLNKIPSSNKLAKYVLDFDKLSELEAILEGEKFDLINSTYSLYYSQDPVKLITLLRDKYLNENGKFVISGPTWEHGLFSLITGKFGDANNVRKTIDFMDSVLTPYLKSLLGPYELHYLNNLSKFESVSEAAAFIQSTTYGSEINPEQIKEFLESLSSLNFRKTSMVAIF